MPKFYHRAPEAFGIYGKMPRFTNPANVFARLQVKCAAWKRP
jgi:hypothetical protein